MDFIEFETIYRQEDDKFISLLNTIRNNTADIEDMRVLNSRVQLPPEDDGFIVTLATTNAIADNVNEEHLDMIEKEDFSFSGDMFGDFDNKQLPADKELILKE